MFSARKERRSLHGFLVYHPDVLMADPAGVARPVLECLRDIHARGQSHGAVCAQRMHFTTDGRFDAGLFALQTAATTRLTEQETFAYYRDGQGETLEEKQSRDLQALSKVLHLMLRGYDPAPMRDASHEREAVWQVEAPWPRAFVDAVQQVMASQQPLGPEVLPALLTALEGTHAGVAEPSPAEPAKAVPEESSTPVTSTDAEPLQTPEAGPEAPRPGAIPATFVKDPEPVFPAPAPARLPNATVGREYAANVADVFSQARFHFSGVRPAQGLPDGLSMDEGTGILKGTPAVPGEYELVMACTPVTEGSRPALELVLLLTINPDPQSLWKNTPSDPSTRYWKPDTAVEAHAGSPLLAVAASLRGRSHAHVGSCRDDDFSIAWLVETGWYVLTAADGAGGSKLSREGSRIACAYVKQYFTGLLERREADPLAGHVEAMAADASSADARTAVRNTLYRHFGTAALNARKLIEEKAAADGAVPRDFHTTLIIVLARPVSTGGWFVAAFSIGDGGAAVVGAPEGTECLLTRPDGGEFAGQTMFLTIKDALATGEAIMNRIKFALVPSFEAIILVTDGISDPRFPSEAALADAGAWKQLWESEVKPQITGATSREHAAQRLLTWMGFPSPGHHDDRTIVVLTETQPPEVS